MVAFFGWRGIGVIDERRVCRSAVIVVRIRKLDVVNDFRDDLLLRGGRSGALRSRA
jgi:hypothetical protein